MWQRIQDCRRDLVSVGLLLSHKVGKAHSHGRVDLENLARRAKDLEQCDNLDRGLVAEALARSI